MQDSRQWLLRCRVPDQAVTQRRRCCHQESVAGQEIQGMPCAMHPQLSIDTRQNRELQIMRIVRHPNIVELKAFYYSNGERVYYVLVMFVEGFAKSITPERRSLPQSGPRICP